ncbi:hypothetical protein I6F11_17455 [Ensifer sp. NBAIM29]|nr:hypothetical protein [Ensifer sp. NBAIM29]
MTKPTARIEVFRTGTFAPMVGTEITYSGADLRAMADAYDVETAPAPLVVGHPAVDAPAYGWVDSFEFDAVADRLYANVGQLEPAFSEAVKAGRYKKVSLSFHRPDSSANPVPGTWYPKHVGFLGGAAPAVTGLKNVQFSAGDNAPIFTADFGERGFEETASILRALREFFIEKFGLEDADKALPGYRIEWLDQTEVEPKPKPAFAAPIPDPLKKEPDVTTTTDPAFAAREADVSAREERLKKRERELAHADNVAFAESVVTDGRLIAASKDKVVAILDALPADAAVSFAAGEAGISVAKAIRDLLAEQPKVVSFGRTDLPETGNAERVSFASDGKQVDPDQLARHEKALAYQRQHPGTPYLDAIHAVS